MPATRVELSIFAIATVAVLTGGCPGAGVPVDAPTPIDTARVDGPAACEAPYPIAPAPPAPPYSGTVFLDPDLLTDADPSSLTSLTFTGQASRQMFDRRTNSFNDVNAFLFEARFGATVTVEVQVNPEFTRAEAETEARFYATAVGRVPGFLFADLRTMWIHKGLFPFGGGNDNLLIHTEQGLDYVRGGFLEEVFLHEGSHTSLDSHHAATARWQEAQRADGTALSTYAADNPTREDLAETVGPYLAQRFWADRLPAGAVDTIRQAIPNRIAYLDCLGLDLTPAP